MTVGGFIRDSKRAVAAAGGCRLACYAVAALAVAACCVVANQIVCESVALGEPAASRDLRSMVLDGESLAYGAVLAIGLFAILVLADVYSRRKPNGSEKTLFARFSFCKAVVVVACVLFAAWIPYAIALYPGVCYDDTAFQLAQFFGEDHLNVYSGAPDPGAAKITDHHPVATTMLYALFSQMGSVLLGAEHRGLFLLCVLQAICLAVSLGWAVVYANRTLRMPRGCAAVLVAVLALNPLMGMYAYSIVKDSLFAPLLAAYAVMYAETMRTRGTYLTRPARALAFALLCIGMALVKKVAVYLVVICMLAACIRCRRGRIASACAGLSSALVVFVLMPIVVFPLVGAASGSYKEMLAVPFAQTALVARDCPEDMRDDEASVVDAMLDMSTLGNRYYLTSADYVKNPAPLAASRLDYARVYIAQGLRHPGLYARAWFALNSGFMATEDVFYPRIASVRYGVLEEIAADQGRSFYAESAPGRAEEQTILKAVDFVAGIPVVGLMSTKALWAFILPVLVLVFMLARRRDALWAFIPFLLFAALLYLGPLSTDYNSGRYVFPLVCLAPIAVGLVLSARSAFEKSS